ncbi:BlaI/MecI/CopY family transcriptional regulator [Olivibacter sitiensis]|uniref:BlaI/MecI/CopY family transcriptional regulator n=1 Tax=Olivibacter sitiensis TaxID=376470 RepID=UPI000418A818|nr:BlaI/MecI/CopY family transcriptional regulator [Olivibacter sitiensis]
MSNRLKPTESELEILGVLWQDGASTVRQVHNVITERREVGYTTTLKVMQNMLEKGLVSRDESSMTHVYEALVNKKSLGKQLIGKLTNDLFSGSVSQLVMQALGSQQPSSAELREIRKYLDKLKNKKK